MGSRDAQRDSNKDYDSVAIAGVDEITGDPEDIKSFRGAAKTYDGLVHKIGVNEHFCRGTGTSTTLSVAASSGDTSITVVDPTGITDESMIQILNGGTRELIHFHVNDVAGSVLTLSGPLDFDHAIGDVINEIEINMAVNGSLVAPVSFKIQPPAAERWQITRVLPTMLGAGPTAMDDGKFGNIAALANGVILRTFIDGAFRTLSHWHKNNDIREDMFDFGYTPNAPAGQNGASGRWTFSKAQFVPDLDGAIGDYIEMLIQDDLRDLDEFKNKGQGRLYGG